MGKKILHIEIHQMKTLQCILLSQLKNFLMKVGNSMKKRKSFNAGQQLRNYFQDLPVTTRSELLNMVLCPYRNFGGMFYQFTTGKESFNTCILVLESLLSLGMDCIDISFPTKGKFSQLLQCLLQNANKLKVLFLPSLKYIYGWYPTEYRPNTLISELLIKNCSWLAILVLGSACNDRMLRTIGENCHCLQNLDIEDSPVSDEGIQVLTQIWECRKGRELENDKDGVDGSLISQQHTNTITKPCNKVHICRYSCYKTKLCHSLRRINLKHTKVTKQGIYALLSTANNLEDIGMCIAYVLDDLYKSYQANPESFQCPYWNLRSLFVSDLSSQHLTMLTKLRTPTKVIKNLQIVVLVDDSIAQTIKHDLQNYLRCYGSDLTNLNVHTFEWAEVDLSSFLKHCPNLISLKLYVSMLTWSNDKKPVPSPSLKFAQLTWNISCESAILFMESASALKEVYFSRLEEDMTFLNTLCEKCISPELKVFYLNSPNFRSNPRLVSEFWQCHKHIEFIGEIDFRLTDLPQLGSAVDLKLIRTISLSI